MIQMDLTIVNVALPSIGRDLHGSTSALQWVIDGYSLALASLLLIGGRIGDRSGHKRVYLTGLAIFGIGSGLCALAPSMGALIGFRIVQGIGAAVELPATLFQQVQGESAIDAGLRFVPLTVAFVITGPLVGRVIDRAGHRAPMAAGCALMGVGCLLLLRAGASSGYGPVWWPFVIIGVGYGLTSTPMAAAVLGAVPRERAGSATAFTSGLHSALVVAGAVALTGAGTAAAFIRSRPHATQGRVVPVSTDEQRASSHKRA